MLHISNRSTNIQQLSTLGRKSKYVFYFLLIGKITFTTMTNIIILTNSSSADEKKKAQLRDLTPPHGIVQKRQNVIWELGEQV